MTGRRPPDAPDDADLWTRATSGVKPLGTAPTATEPRRRRSTAAALPRSEDDAATTRIVASFEVRLEDERVTGRASDAPHALVKALGRGEPSPEARLDLHGFTRDTALREVEGFVIRSRAAGCRSVLIITGRGEVLRAAVAEWLARSSCAAHLLAFSSAPPRLGGPGAVAVLLRRSERKGR